MRSLDEIGASLERGERGERGERTLGRGFASGEEAIRRSLALLRSTLESTADGLLVVDREGRIVAHNRRFGQMWGVDEEILEAGDDAAAIAAVVNQLVDPDDFVTRVRALYAQPYGESFDVLRFKDGRVFERFSIPLIEAGEPVGRVWSFRDATERVRAQAALAASEERYRSLFERHIGGLFRNSVEGKILDCNDAFARILGYSSRWDLIGRDAVELYFDVAERERAIAELREFASLSDRELCMRRRDGSAVWVSATESLQPGVGGEPDFLEGSIVDITARKEAERQIYHLAYHDSLTGLPNRALLLERLNEALVEAAELDGDVAVLFLDLDQFKRVNDTLGHSAGDRMLQQIASRLLRVAGRDETVARVGGDEFILLVPRMDDPRRAEELARRILKVVEEPMEINGRRLFVTTSIGLSLFPTDGADAEALLTGADVAMYRAKDRGRNGYQLCSPDLSAQVFAQMTLESELRLGLEQSEFDLFYQPQIEIATGRTVGFEALMRWRHPTRGLVPPAEFIAAAESSFLIGALGRWALAAGCREASAWPASARLAVNLSPHQLVRGDLLATVQSILAETGFPANRLDLEITESAAVAEVERTAHLLAAIRETGVRVALDDFGAGHASFSYLQRLPLDVLKIDREFVRGIDQGRQGRAIVTAIIELARGLGLQTIAEGVETPAQLEFLRERGCDLYQGYLAAAAMPSLAARRWISGRG